MPHERMPVAVGPLGGHRVARRAPAVVGASHFLEHLLFKGTAERSPASSIAEALDGVGGD